MKVSRKSKGVLQVELDYHHGKMSPENFLLISDIHWDHPDCQRDLLKGHLEEAKKIGAGILVFGDLFDAMQGKKDPRGRKSELRPEFLGDAYFDKLVRQAAEYFNPYPIKLLARGNHELSVMSHNEIDLIERLGYELGVAVMGYEGWVLFLAKRYTKEGKRVGWAKVKLHFTHGSGGNSPVTKGVIQTARRAAYLPDANISLSGHIHEGWQFPVMRERISDKGNVYTDEQLHLQLPSYKGLDDEGISWERQRGMAPKPLGGWWLTLKWFDDRYEWECRRAK